MISIYQIVQEAINSGYLTLLAEEQLRELLKTHYDLQDFEAFMWLQKATCEGFIKQESRELFLKKTKSRIEYAPNFCSLPLQTRG